MNSELSTTNDAALIEREPVEVMRDMISGSDEEWLKTLERAAANAGRLVAAYNKILVAIALDGDWVSHNGKTASLCAAGAERFLKHFQFNFVEWSAKREEWSDAEGDAYRWIYECTCIHRGTAIRVEGRYSTRDKLLGKVGSEWRPLTEINEGDIRAAARHTCISEGVKILLGLRHIPISVLQELGVNVEGIHEVKHNSGAQGGVESISKGEMELQRQLQAMCMVMAGNDPKVAGDLLLKATTFKNKDGETITGKRQAKYLKGSWLTNTHKRCKEKFIVEFGQDEFDIIAKGEDEDGDQADDAS